MNVRIGQAALAAWLASWSISAASDPPKHRLSVPTPTIAPPPIAPTHVPVFTKSPTEAAHDHDHPHHDHLDHNHDDCEECIPGVYTTEVHHFRGYGFVAREKPFSRSLYTLERAGNPHHISHLAEPSYGHDYTGYYVGGGASLFKKPGFPHRRKEGTWGWDYKHAGLKRRVHLLFSRGRLYQDGDGMYESDPPFEIPNIFAIRYGDRIHRVLGHENE